MFDLESQISKWRAGLESVGIVREAADELESHLRDDIERSSRDGVGIETAFELALWHIGRPVDISRKFKAADRAHWLTRGYFPLWGKLLAGVLSGAALALGFYLVFPPVFQSQATILVRHVIGPSSRTSTVGGADVRDARGDMLIELQLQIIRSLDLAREVARSIGPEKILASIGGGNDVTLAAVEVQKRLRVVNLSGSSVIRVSFQHPDPSIAQVVTQEVVERYKRTSALVNTADVLGVDRGVIQSIATVQSPTPSLKDWRSTIRVSVWAIFAGLLGGGLWAAFEGMRNRSARARSIVV